MVDSTIITGQFVRISQTPASIGERLLARMVDYIVQICYFYFCTELLSFIHPYRHLPDAWATVACLAIYLPLLFYSLLFEIFNRGQSIGKMLLNIRVVKLDGSVPTMGAYLLRWLLYSIDMTGGIGLLVTLLTRHSQRLGDLAAGTLVVKIKNYRKIHVSLDEFDFLSHNYHPTYPQAADLSLEQIDVITRTLQSDGRERAKRISLLSEKVKMLWNITSLDENPEHFLQTILHDYQYYALEE